MIRNTILIALLLFLFYSLLLLLFPGISSSQHQNQDNIIKAQKYIYGFPGSHDYVIVGSSLSTRLVKDSLPGYFDLSFGGLSIFDGLQIIQKVAEKPKVVFIEMNILQRDTTEAFLSSLFNPVNYFLKKHFMALRHDRQPVSYLVTRLVKFIQSFRNFIIPKESFNNTIQATQVNPVVYQKMLDSKVRELSQKIDQTLLDIQINKLKGYVDNLKVQDIRIIFYEIPVNHQLENLGIPVSIRQTFYNTFPASIYSYIDLPDVQFVTSDGMHLLRNEAIYYTQYFRKIAGEYLKLVP